LNDTEGLEAALPATSTARAATLCEPFAAEAVDHANVYGALLALPTFVPSTRKSTWSTPVLSVAVALSVLVPAMVAPATGAVSVTDGGVVSNWSACAPTGPAFPALSYAR
jgi:hypothetical protein